jgi:hypothetical protein
MSKKRKQRKVSENKQQIARITKKRLIVLIASLSAAFAFLVFQPGVDSWPIWMIDLRRVFIAILGFTTIFLILMSPIIVVTESDPRPLSGPGKNPQTGGGSDH